MLELRLPPDIEKRLDDVAKQTGRSKTDYVIAAIIAHLDDLDDAELASQRLEDIRAGRERTT